MELDGPTSLEAHRSHTCVSQLAHRSMRQTHLWFRIRNYGSAGIYSAKPIKGEEVTRSFLAGYSLQLDGVLDHVYPLEFAVVAYLDRDEVDAPLAAFSVVGLKVLSGGVDQVRPLA